MVQSKFGTNTEYALELLSASSMYAILHALQKVSSTFILQEQVSAEGVALSAQAKIRYEVVPISLFNSDDRSVTVIGFFAFARQVVYPEMSVESQSIAKLHILQIEVGLALKIADSQNV